jgi:predicted metal-dependent phosphoesterase TrpH
MVIHRQKITSKWGGQVNGTLCNRFRNDLADGMNLTDKDEETTCKFCKKILEIKRRAGR